MRAVRSFSPLCSRAERVEEEEEKEGRLGLGEEERVEEIDRRQEQAT